MVVVHLDQGRIYSVSKNIFTEQLADKIPSTFMESILTGVDEFIFVSLCLIISAYLGMLANSNKYLARISGVAVTMFCGALLSNFGVLPAESQVYDAIWKYFVPFSIPFMLMEANFKAIYKNTGKMLIVYLLGALGTLVGSVISYLIVYVGPETHKIIAMLAASNIGGSVNLVAVSQSLDLIETSFFLASNAADNISMALYFLLMTFVVHEKRINRFFQNLDKQSYLTARADKEEMSGGIFHTVFVAHSSITSCVISLMFFCVGKLTMHFLYFDGGVIIVITFLSLLFTNLFPSAANSLAKSKDFAQILIMIFFAVIGANCNLKIVINVAPHLFLVMICMITFQFGFAIIGAKVFGVSIPETVIACNANAGGPATAGAMASAYGWHQLVVPGILCGVLGYAIGTFVGVFIGRFLESFDLQGFLQPLELLINF